MISAVTNRVLRHEWVSLPVAAMPRLRAPLALLLAVTWCSAALHSGLEAAGMVPEHEHHTQAAHPAAGAPGVADSEHEPVLVRNFIKDSVARPAVGGVLWFAFVGLAAFAGLPLRRQATAATAWRVRRRSEPPLHKTWQFAWRCAPESAAPPAFA
jgi:hypothetical protein